MINEHDLLNCTITNNIIKVEKIFDLSICKKSIIKSINQKVMIKFNNLIINELELLTIFNIDKDENNNNINKAAEKNFYLLMIKILDILKNVNNFVDFINFTKKKVYLNTKKNYPTIDLYVNSYFNRFKLIDFTISVYKDKLTNNDKDNILTIDLSFENINLRSLFNFENKEIENFKLFVSNLIFSIISTSENYKINK